MEALGATKSQKVRLLFARRAIQGLPLLQSILQSETESKGTKIGGAAALGTERGGESLPLHMVLDDSFTGVFGPC